MDLPHLQSQGILLDQSSSRLFESKSKILHFVNVGKVSLWWFAVKIVLEKQTGSF